ncbi:colicin Z C-terminal domain-related protein [Vreelandella titanicae]|uniref:colicin Z C-terminal domain-related protein n=1 Tax=Vreelandella titanicae TaxID=664683 RepID=UPI003FD78C81
MAGTGEVQAPAYTWGQWRPMRSSSGGPATSYTVTFKSISNVPTGFTAEVEYVSPTGLKTKSAFGPGSMTIESGGGVGTDRIRFQSHGPQGQLIQFVYS